MWRRLYERDCSRVSPRPVQRLGLGVVQQLQRRSVWCGAWAYHSGVQCPVSDGSVRQRVGAVITAVQRAVCGGQLWWQRWIDGGVMLGAVSSWLHVCGGVCERDSGRVSGWSVLVGWCGDLQ